MNKTCCILLAILALILLACKKPVEPAPDSQDGVGPAVLSVVIDSENGAKATLNDGTGDFAFSSGDQIKVYAGEDAYIGETTSTSNAGAFTMSSGFPLNQAGLVGFPADIVTGINSSSVTFTLPTTYTYSQVGSSDANTGKAPVPMVGKYSAPGSGNPKVTLKQAGSVVRFRLTNIAAGRVSFTFSSNVTGQVTLSSPDPENWGDDSGILTANLSKGGATITVSDFPSVADGEEFAYVTLPVPTGTTPDGIIVINTPDEGLYTQIDLSTGASALNRAYGYKISARPYRIREPKFLVAEDRYVILASGNLMGRIDEYDAETHSATIDKWEFQGPFEFVGNGNTTGNYLFYEDGSSDCEGKWIDMFAWQGEGSTLPVHGVILAPSSSDYMGDFYSPGQTTYTGCWETKDGNASTDLGNYIHISNGGEYKWRMMTAEEWTYMLKDRTTSTLNGVTNASFARVRIGTSDGLLLFPEDIGSKWNTTTMGAYPSSINDTGEYAWGTDTYTATQYGRMQEVGVMFLPKSGLYYTSKWMMDRGYYWTNSASPTGYGSGAGASGSKYAYRMSVIDEHLYTTAEAHERTIAAAVRLVRDVPTP